MDRSPVGSATYVAFAAAVVIGGLNFVAVRISNQELPPFWGAGLRFALAAAVFTAIALARGLPWPRRRQLATTAVYGVLSFAASYALMYWALTLVTAGLAAVVLAAVPLLTPVLAWVHGIEPLDRRALLGAVVALAGIVWITIGTPGLSIPVGGLLAMVLATLTIAESVIVAKRIADNHPVVTNAVGMALGAVLLGAFSLLVGETWALPEQPEVVASLAYLVTLGSVGLFVLFLRVIRRWTVSATSYAFVLFPVVTMLGGAWILSEPLTIQGVVGALVVTIGVWFGAFAPRGDGMWGTPRPGEA